MKYIFDIGHTDLRLFLKKKSAYVWLFAVPFMFMYFFGNAIKGDGDPSNRHPKVFVKNEDTNFLSEIFLKELGKQDLKLSENDRNEASAEIHIPADFTDKVLALEKTKVQLLKGQKSDYEADRFITEMALVRALVSMNGHLLEAAASTNTVGSLTEDRLNKLIKKSNPVSLNAHFAGKQPVPSGFNFSLPSNLVTYLLMNLMIFGGVTMAAERRNGVLKRLATSPIRRAEIIGGKLYGLMLLGAVQIAFFLALGKFAFRVNLGANFPGVVLVLLIFAWVAASLGVLVGSVLSAEDRVAGICVLTSLVLAALGGCWWPIEVAPSSARIIAMCVPTGWAMQALNQLITFGNGLNAITLPMIVLIGCGAAANFLAARFFRN